jgi:predicted amino acid dehydrogenase
MKFATIAHLLYEEDAALAPREWFEGDMIISPELNIHGTKGHVAALLLTAVQVMNMPRPAIRKQILDAAVHLQESHGVQLIHLGGLTTSVTQGGLWMAEQSAFHGFFNHGDSYTAAVTVSTVERAVEMSDRRPADLSLAIVGAYGIIGEAVSKRLVPQFGHTTLVGRKPEKLRELARSLTGDFTTTVNLETNRADVVVTATNHPTALLGTEHLKTHATVVDVSQPPNVSPDLCRQRPDVLRVDGGLVDFPPQHRLPIPGVPPGKMLACIAEVIMQASENEKRHYVGSIDPAQLEKTAAWGKKYGFEPRELTAFGRPLQRSTPVGGAGVTAGS